MAYQGTGCKRLLVIIEVEEVEDIVEDVIWGQGDWGDVNAVEDVQQIFLLLVPPAREADDAVADAGSLTGLLHDRPDVPVSRPPSDVLADLLRSALELGQTSMRECLLLVNRLREPLVGALVLRSAASESGELLP